MKMKLWMAASVAVAALTAGFPRTGEAAPPRPGQGGDRGAVRVTRHDLDLLDQEGKQGKVYTDFIGNRLVAITFTYTTCPTAVAPILDSIFLKLQGLLGDELGNDVTLVTISIDPVTDTPPRLLEHATKLGARPGWTFLTGRKENIDLVLNGIGIYTGGNHDHQPVIVVGDMQQGVWKRLHGFPSAEKVRRALLHLKEGRKLAGQPAETESAPTSQSMNGTTISSPR